MKTWLAMLCTCLALGLVVAGCGGDDDDSSDSGSAGTTSEQAPAADTGEDTSGSGGAAAGGGKTVAVSMKDIAFKPALVSVPKGGTVTWTNDDSVGHDVTKTDGPGPDFKSGDPGAMSSGDTYEQTFKVAGTIKYVCSVHPGMEGAVVVK